MIRVLLEPVLIPNPLVCKRCALPKYQAFADKDGASRVRHLNVEEDCVHEATPTNVCALWAHAVWQNPCIHVLPPQYLGSCWPSSLQDGTTHLFAGLVLPLTPSAANALFPCPLRKCWGAGYCPQLFTGVIYPKLSWVSVFVNGHCLRPS